MSQNITKVAIDSIVFDKDLYPRQKRDDEVVNSYRDAIDELPPIVLSKNFVLIDGFHRLIAFKLEGKKEIPAEILDITDRNEILLEAIRRNVKHGKQLSRKEKRVWGERLFRNGFEKKRIAKELSVSERAVNRWVKHIEDEQREEIIRLIMELYLQCYSENEIVEELARRGIVLADTQEAARKKVERKVGQIRQMSKMSNPPDSIQYYNVWKTFQLSDDQLRYPGQIPEELIENLLWYYTEPDQIVLDPMAGSGVVGDVCKRMFRRYVLFDIDPIDPLKIRKGDVLEGIKMPAQKKADFVFLDPPYYNLMAKDYPDNEFTKSYSSFLNAMEKVFRNCMKVSNTGARMSLILKPMNENLLDGEWLDMSFDCVEIAKEMGLKYIKRICAPLSTQQFNSTHVVKAKDKKKMLNTLRDILIFEMED